MLTLSRDASTARSCILQLRVELLEPGKRDLDLIEILDGPNGLEQWLQGHRSILAEAEAKQDANAESVIAALLGELHKTRAGGQSAAYSDGSGLFGSTSLFDESQLEADLTDPRRLGATSQPGPCAGGPLLSEADKWRLAARRRLFPEKVCEAIEKDEREYAKSMSLAIHYYVLRKPLWRPRRPRIGCGARLVRATHHHPCSSMCCT